MDNQFDNQINTEGQYNQTNTEIPQQNVQDNYQYNVGGGQSSQYNQNGDGMDTTPLTVGEWALTILALAIPCVGFILYCVWAFSKTGNINRRNFCRAGLIIYAVCILIYVLIFVVFGAALLGGMGSYYY
ncbi:hypothetical protein [Suipraeoptans intestinalis]|nr:hypothetical protein [Suipraeoptans intestinalis]MDD7770731.1 hypothetical protein [Suipraeoptans intestinalis]